MAIEKFDNELVEKAIVETAKEMFQVMPNPPMTNDPVTEICDVIEYKGRMRITSFDKFQASSFVTAVSFYGDEDNLKEEKNARATLTVSVKEEEAVRLLTGIGQKDFDEEDAEAVLEECGKLSVAFAEKFQTHLSKSGYMKFVMSEPIKTKNSIPQGVNFPFKMYKYLEVQFELWRNICFIVSAVVDPTAK